MPEQSMAAPRAHRNRTAVVGGVVAVAAVATFGLLGPTADRAVGAGGVAPGAKNLAVRLEAVVGSKVKRVVLSPQAAERLGIEMGSVGEEVVVRRQWVGGLVVPPSGDRPAPQLASAEFGGFGQSEATPVTSLVAPVEPLGEAWVKVTLSQAEWERLAKDQPARILPLATRAGPAAVASAWPSGKPPVDDVKRSMMTIDYVVSGTDHGLMPHQRVRVELPLAGSEEKRRVVPYGAVYYDAQGSAWAYVNPAPLVFERHPITIEGVTGDVAVLSDGPPVGTPVVSIGAALLYGAEIFGK